MTEDKVYQPVLLGEDNSQTAGNSNLDKSFTGELGSNGIAINTSSFLGGNGFKDYIPGKPEPRVPVKKEMSPHDRRVIVHKGVDYATYEQTLELNKTRDTKVSQLAKKLVLENRDAIRRYELACKIVSEATENDLANPNDRLQKAIRIKAKGHPMSEEQAKEKAEGLING